MEKLANTFIMNVYYEHVLIPIEAHSLQLLLLGSRAP